MQYRFVILSLLSCWFLRFFGQEPHFYNYRTNEGLPSNECYNVKQDNKGYIWIATDRGVCRYDGYNFRNFTTADGLTDNTVFKIKEDARGRVWFMSFNGKLCWYQDGKIVQYKFNDQLLKVSEQKGIIRSFMVDRNDNVTISYLYSGLIRIDTQGRSVVIPSVGKSGVEDFFAREIDGELFVGSIFLNQSTRKEYHFSTNIGGKERSLLIQRPDFAMRDIVGLKRKNGTGVVSLERSMIEITEEDLKVFPPAEKQALSLMEDCDSSLWIGFFKGGVIKKEANKKLASPSSGEFLEGLSVTSILQDNEKGYWFATLENGIYYMPSTDVTIHKLESASNKDFVNSLVRAGERFIYAGTANGILYTADISARDRYRIVQKDSIGGAVETLYYDSLSRKLWIGTLHRLAVYGEDKKLKIVSEGHTRGIASGGGNKIVCLRVPTILSIDPLFTEPIGRIDPVLRVDVMYTDERNVIWLGAADGLYYLKNGRSVKDTFIGTQRVIDVACLPGGRLVVATIGGGIIVKDGQRKLRIDAKSGLISDIVNSICVNGDEIWAATNKGISCVRLNDDGSFSIRNYNQNQGLPTPDIKKILVHNGLVWLGSNPGLISFRPGKIDLSAVPVYLESVKANAVETERHVFSHTEDFLEFNFTGISFKQRGKIIYRYRLIGSSDLWNETENRTVQLAALKPGDYRFELIARNADGVWNKNVFIYAFSIKSPFWQTPFFYAGLILLFLLVVFLWYRFRIRQIRKRNELVLELQEYQRQAMVSQINPHFIFNSLNSIHSFVLNENRKDASKYLSSFAQLIRKCLNHSSKKYVPLEEERQLLQTYLDLEVMRFKKKFRYELIIEPQVIEAKIEIPSMLMQPFIENAIHHGLIPLETRQGLVRIRLFFKEAQLRCEIEDNGIGRAQAGLREKKNHNSKGTEITGKRLKAYEENPRFEFYEAITDLHDAEGKPAGTKVAFNIPYEIV